ncbi:hypothetical protein FQA39_LY04906 [Lamprigera yunnana]|nr:hypothetical protein FQA39_LY04906 [Lamprigera yunnana]
MHERKLFNFLDLKATTEIETPRSPPFNTGLIKFDFFNLCYSRARYHTRLSCPFPTVIRTRAPTTRDQKHAYIAPDCVAEALLSLFTHLNDMSSARKIYNLENPQHLQEIFAILYDDEQETIENFDDESDTDVKNLEVLSPGILRNRSR